MDLPSVPEDLRFGGTAGEVHIADYALLGAHSIVLPGVELPEGFACAAHTVIRRRDYEPWTLYGGYDCQKLYPRRLDDTTRAKLRAIVQTLRG
jgi:acetyltransferase-like isoleucine patch superfamily enzyme